MERFFASRWFGGPSVVGADDDGENPKSARDRKRAFASAWRPEGVVAGRERALRTAWTRAAAATTEKKVPEKKGKAAATAAAKEDTASPPPAAKRTRRGGS